MPRKSTVLNHVLLITPRDLPLEEGGVPLALREGPQEPRGVPRAGAVPHVHRLIHRLKAGNYRRLAHRLQRIESRFLFDDVIPRLLARHPDTWMVSIHDSLLVRESDVELARGAFTAAFDLGMHPKLH